MISCIRLTLPEISGCNCMRTHTTQRSEGKEAPESECQGQGQFPHLPSV